MAVAKEGLEPVVAFFAGRVTLTLTSLVFLVAPAFPAFAGFVVLLALPGFVAGALFAD